MISMLPLNSIRQTPPVGQVPAPTGTVSFSDLLNGGTTQCFSVPEASFQIDADAPGEGNSLARLQDQERLFTFTELGMFGRHHAQFMPADKFDLEVTLQPEVTSASAPSMAPARKLGDLSLAEGRHILSIKDTSSPPPQLANEVPVKSRESLFAPVQQSAEWLAANGADSMSTEGETAKKYPVANEGAVLPSLPSSINTERFEFVSNEEALSPLEDGASMHAPSVDLESQNSAPINLAVLGSSDALVVSIRSPIEAGESMIRLRQAVENMAAEFGMDVAELRINGSPLGQISTSVKGGSNGGRAG